MLNGQNIELHGTCNLDNDMTVAGSHTVYGDATVTGKQTVTGDLILHGFRITAGSKSLAPNTPPIADLVVQGALQTNGSMIVDHQLYADGIHSSGAVFVVKDINIGGNNNVQGDINFEEDFQITKGEFDVAFGFEQNETIKGVRISKTTGVSSLIISDDRVILVGREKNYPISQFVYGIDLYQTILDLQTRVAELEIKTNNPH